MRQAINGSLDFNLISLFPPTYKGRKNGMRIDIVEALEQLHPVSNRLIRPCPWRSVLAQTFPDLLQ